MFVSHSENMFELFCKKLQSSSKWSVNDVDSVSENESVMAHILLVEDDEDNISLLTRLLEHHGHQLIVATDGESAVEQSKTEGLQLILMDLELPPAPEAQPDPNAGLEATRRIKGTAETSQIPVIALTAHTMAHHQEKISAAGCDDLQEKPIFPFDSLLKKIDSYTG